MKTNAFGTIRAGRKHLPEDIKDIFQEVKEYEPGQFQTCISEKAGLVVSIVKSNQCVRMITNCHSTTDEVWLNRFISSDNEDAAEEETDEKEQKKGRKTIKT